MMRDDTTDAYPKAEMAGSGFIIGWESLGLVDVKIALDVDRPRLPRTNLAIVAGVKRGREKFQVNINLIAERAERYTRFVIT
jgi:hypothetical protein